MEIYCDNEAVMVYREGSRLTVYGRMASVIVTEADQNVGTVSSEIGTMRASFRAGFLNGRTAVKRATMLAQARRDVANGATLLRNASLGSPVNTSAVVADIRRAAALVEMLAPLV